MLKKIFIGLLSLAIAIVGIPSSAHAYSYSGVTMNYTYSGTISSSSCANPARGQGYFGEIYKVNANATVALYVEDISIGDPFIQVLASDKRQIIAQDDDGGGGLNSFIGSVAVDTSQYIVATTFSANSYGNYNLHSSVPLTKVTSCPQVITVTAGSSFAYGSTLNFSASTNMSLPVTVSSQTPSVCTVSSSSAPNFTISSVTPGTCTIVSSQAGSGSVEAAPSVTTNITVSAKVLTLTGLTASKDYDGTTSATLVGTPALSGVISGDDVSLSGTPTGTYNTAAAGSKTVTVSGLSLVGAKASYYSLTNTFPGTINKINQTITWAPTTRLLVSASGQLMNAATTTGDGPITYSIVSAGSTSCAVSGRTLSFTNIGFCTVRATAASTTNYNVATKDLVFETYKLEQVVSWSPTLSLLMSLSGQNMATATTTGDGAITYSVVSTGTAQCSVSGRALSYSGVGTCEVRATAAATGTYLAATADYTFSTYKLAQTVEWSPSRLLLMSDSGSTIATATTTGDGLISYSVTSAGTANCSLSGRILTYTGQGTCTITATAASSTDYNADSISKTFTVSKLNQVVTWSPETTFEALPGTKTLAAAETSGDGALSYSVVSQGATGCEISGRVLTYTGAGTCTVRATANDSVDYDSASLEVELTITRSAQSISWAPTVTSVPATALSLLPNETPVVNGSGAVSYSVVSAGNTGCSVNAVSGQITFTRAGSCSISATAAETPAETSVSTVIIFSFAAVAQEVTWTPAVSTIQLPTSNLRISGPAVGSYGGTISYSVQSAGTTGCSVNSTSGLIAFTNSGSCTIRATAAATDVALSGYKDVRFTILAPAVIDQVQPPITGDIESQIVVSPIEINLNPGQVLKSSSGDSSEITIGANGLPELTPLQSLGLVAGAPIPVSLEPLSQETGLRISGSGFQVKLESPNKLNESGQMILTAGKTLSFEGTGFAPSANVVVWLFSTPTKLGQVTTDSDGSFKGELPVPSAIPAGNHTIQLNGLTTSGKARSLAVGVEVTKETSKTSTQTSTNSSWVDSLWLVAAFAALIGGTWYLRRRRSN